MSQAKYHFKLKNQITYIFSEYFNSRFFAKKKHISIKNNMEETVGYIDNLALEDGIVYCSGWALVEDLSVHISGQTNNIKPTIYRKDLEELNSQKVFFGFEFKIHDMNNLIGTKINFTFNVDINHSSVEPISIDLFSNNQLSKILIFLSFLFQCLNAAPDIFQWYKNKDSLSREKIFSRFHVLRDTKLDLTNNLFTPLMQNQFRSNNKKNIKVTIILPVFNAFELLKECIMRVSMNTDIQWKLLIIEDCSTDERVRPYLQKLANLNENFELILNNKNLGFVKSVNRAFELFLLNSNAKEKNVEEHCILLNSDAMVPKNWSSRLLQPIQKNKNIASVTPFSNDAELLSIPHIVQNTKLDLNQVDEIDDIASKFVETYYDLNLPTSVGFCMAINRYWLQKNPQFDEIFGQGYGEEVDWCQKIKRIGGKHVVAYNLFVEHKGGSSFGNNLKNILLKRNGQIVSNRYPNFDRSVQKYVANDPLIHFRLALAITWAASKDNIDSFRFYIAHSLGGGAEKWLQEKVQSHLSSDVPVAILRFGGAKRVCVEVITKNGITKASTNNLELVSELLKIPKKKSIIYSNCVGDIAPHTLPDFIMKNLGKKDKSVLLMHDFFPISPSYNLLDENSEIRDTWAIDFSSNVHQFKDKDGLLISNLEWQSKWKKLAKLSEIIVFSANSKKLLSNIWPELVSQITVKPHKTTNLISKHSINHDFKTPVLGVLGGINFAKGAGVILELSDLLDKKGTNEFKIVIIGNLDTNYNVGTNVHIHGKYDPDELESLTDKYRISHWIVPSIWPETFCFVAHEALSTGLPVFSMKIGAHGDLISKSKQGLVFPYSNSKKFACAVFEKLLTTNSNILDKNNES